jgi:hypothetical protein
MLFKRKKRVERPMPDFLMAWLVRERAWRVKLSKWLSAKTARLSRRQLLTTYAAFVIAGTLAYTWVIVKAVSSPDRPVIPSSVTLPQAVRAHRSRIMLVPDDGAAIARLLDSLRRDPVAGPALDSLFKARPGLADSLAQVAKSTK